MHGTTVKKRSSFREDITRVVLRRKVYCHVQYSPPIVNYLKKINQVQALLFYLFKNPF